MPSLTDTQFAARFPDITASTFYAASPTLANYVPTTSLLNTGMLADIGRATIYGPDTQDNFYNRFMKSELARGDSELFARFSDVSSAAYSPNAAYTTLFDGQKPTMMSSVATKNFSRQIRVEVNERYLKQMAQTEEMIGDVSAAIMASSNACYMDDMWVASKEYFSGSTRGALSAQSAVLTNDVGDPGFEDEINEVIWDFAQNKGGYKSALYNAAQANTKMATAHIALRKDVEYPAFKKMYSDTFHPDFLRVEQTIDYVDDFATIAGAPATAGDLLGMIVDDRAFSITPMPEALTVESFRNPARKATTYFTTYEYAFHQSPFFDVFYIFAPQ